MERLPTTPHDAVFRQMLMQKEMRYAIAAMQHHLDAGHKTLPLVVPILFYHGMESPWPFSLNWHHLVTLLTQNYLTESQIDVLINYMLKAGQTTEPGVLIRQLAQSAPQYKEQLMTIAEWLEEKGRAEGLEKGLQEGRQVEARSIARKMLASGLEPQLIADLTGLTPEELVTLAH